MARAPLISLFIVACSAATAHAASTKPQPPATRRICYVAEQGPFGKSPKDREIILRCKIGRTGAPADCRIVKQTDAFRGPDWRIEPTFRFDLKKLKATDGGSPVGCYTYIHLTVTGPLPPSIYDHFPRVP